jgi:hypothetical protein
MSPFADQRDFAATGALIHNHRLALSLHPGSVHAAGPVGVTRRAAKPASPLLCPLPRVPRSRPRLQGCASRSLVARGGCHDERCRKIKVRLFADGIQRIGQCALRDVVIGGIDFRHQR